MREREREGREFMIHSFEACRLIIRERLISFNLNQRQVEARERSLRRYDAKMIFADGPRRKT